MSTDEYNNLFLKCQSTGKYHMFTFDIVSSKKIPSELRNITHNKMIELMKMIYSEIKKIQVLTNKKILVFDSDFIAYGSDKRLEGFGMKIEPFVYGDTFGFTIYRNSLSIEEVYSIYNRCYRKLEIDFDFHLSNGYYETNDFVDGNNQYFRGYAIDLISNLHKSSYEKIRRQLKKEEKNE